MVRIPTHRSPTHPGEMLREEFLRPLGLSQRELANALRIPHQHLNDMMDGQRGVTPDIAHRLAQFFGMSAAFWLNLQARYDLYLGGQNEREG